MELRRNEKITFRCTELEKDALAEQAARCSLSVSEYCRSLSLGGAQGEVHRGGTAASPGHSPVERNAPTAEQLLRWSPVPGSVRGEPGTNYRAQKNTLTMIGKGKSISHGVAALEYDLAKEINGQAVATEIARHELYGCTGAEMVQEMKPYHIDFPNVKNNCLRFEVSPSIEESATFTDADWAELGNDFMQRMGLANHQYIIIRHSGTESKKEQAHLHILANRVSLSGELYRDNWIGKKATEAANAIAKERNFVQSQDIGKVNKAEIKEAMDGVLKKMQGFDFTKFKEELGKRGFKVREARASTGKLNGYYVTARSGTEYKASEIGKGYTRPYRADTKQTEVQLNEHISWKQPHPEAAASNVKQGQYSPRKRKDTTPRVNPQLAVELVYQELKRVEVYTKRIEDATARKVQIDGKSLESAENRLKNVLADFERQGYRMKNGGYVDKRISFYSILCAVISLLFACFMCYLWTDAAKDRDNYKQYYEYYQEQAREQKGNK